MKYSKKQQLIQFFVWGIIVFPCLFIASHYFPSLLFDWKNAAFLFVILFLILSLPLKIQKVNLSLESWITFIIFLQYGLFAGIIFMHLALLIIIITRESTMPLLTRIFGSSTVLTLASMISGFIFHSAGGVIGSQDFSAVLLFSLLYVVTYTVSNQLLLKLAYFFCGRPYELFTEGALWNSLLTLVMLPFSISLYFLYAHIGNKSVLLVGIPFLIVLLVVKKYTESNDLNDKLAHASEIGRELADHLRFDEVNETFISKLKDVVSYDNAYIFGYGEGEEFVPLMGYEDGELTKRMDGIQFDLKAVGAIDLEDSRIFSTYKEVTELKSIRFLFPVESVMTVPVHRNDRTEGLLLFTSSEKNRFQSTERKIVDILAGYLAISLEKARYFERTLEDSERCALTKLHNFRYLDTKLNEEMVRYHTGEVTSLSAIMLDIDYFKKVNDTYGHESGNTILVKLAAMLSNHVVAHETLARYGGEEFVLVLPDCTKFEASERAEVIREEVENMLFTIIPDLSDDRTPIDVQITVSLGVANIPNDARDVKALMRNADRALYIGGKQAGRNRVGVYGEEVVSV